MLYTVFQTEDVTSKNPEQEKKAAPAETVEIKEEQIDEAFKEQPKINVSLETGPVSSRLERAKKAVEKFDQTLGDAALAGSASRVNVDQKMMINCKADLNQLVPFKYDWAWQKYLDGCANHWMPQEINMTSDIVLWKSEDGLTE